MRNTFFDILVVISLVLASCQTRNKEFDMSVLYVGIDPQKGIPQRSFSNGAGIAANRYEEDVQGRIAAFVELLNQYFAEVKAVDARDYEENMTENVDVVIFDAVTNPLPRVNAREKPFMSAGSHFQVGIQKEGLESAMNQEHLFEARYFPDMYAKPTVFIGDVAGIMGASLGLKLDWFCRCLDACAYDMKSEHQIFHGPLSVDLDMEERLAPVSALNGVEGISTPGVMDMWQVQTEGFHENGGEGRYRQGLVARGDGFEENGDAERISGGVSDKGREAVAIGRHGNFFMWGFAADPNHMTESGKRVLVNAICYISQFDGQKPIGRKMNPGFVTRNKIKAQLAANSVDMFAVYKKERLSYNEKLSVVQREADSMRMRGELLPSALREDASRKPLSIEKDYETWWQGVLLPDATRACFEDMDVYYQYLRDNFDYFYGGKGDFQFVVDEDLKYLGIPMGNIRILHTAIELLNGAESEKEMGKRLLKRYTLESFPTAQAWREWLNREEKQLIFSESCGYKFMNKEKGMEIPKVDEFGKSATETTHDNPVKIVAIRGKDRILIEFTIAQGFHIYAPTGDEGAYVLTAVDFRFPVGVQKNGQLQCPEGKVYKSDSRVRIYEGKVILTQPIKLRDGKLNGKIYCEVTYQACNESICLPPTTMEVEVFNIKQ